MKQSDKYNLENLETKDFDHYISQKSILKDEDKIRLKQKLDNKNPKKSLFPYFMTAAALFVATVIIFQISSDPSHPTDRNDLGVGDTDDKFDLKDISYDENMSKSELKVALNQLQQQLAELEAAKGRLETTEYVVLKDQIKSELRSINQLIDQKEVMNKELVQSKQELHDYFLQKIPGLKRAEKLGFVDEVNQTIELGPYELQIEKLWYSSSGFYVFNSVSTDEEFVNIYVNIIYSFQDQRLEEEWRDSIKVDDKLYYVVKYPPLDELQSDFDKNIPFDIEIRLDDEAFTKENYAIPISYSRTEEYKFTEEFPINQTIDLKNGTIHVKNLESRIDQNVLNVSVSMEDGYRLDGINVILNGRERFIPIYYDKENLTLSFPPFDTKPSQIEVNFDYAQIISNDSFSFNLDVSDIDFNETLELNELVGKVGQTDFYLEQVQWNKSSEGIEVLLSEKFNQANRYVLFPIGPSIPFFRQHSREFNQLTVQDENGNELNYKDFSSFKINELQKFGFVMPSSIAEETDEVQITISNLLYYLGIDESIKVETN